MSKVYKSVLELVGNTPIIQLQNCVPQNGHRFFGKVEYFNPGGSVKDRIAISILEEAERAGQLKPGGTVVEATSGNTGVGLAMVAALKGYKCVFVMPDKISEEKRAMLRAYGARVVITPTGVEPDDPRSHYEVARKFVEITPGSFYTNQYHNPQNAKKHLETTGPEIWDQMEGKVDVFVAGAGTGGTISGVGRYLKSKNPNVKIVCADPFGSILHDLFYFKEIRNKPHSYLVEGIGEDMVPENVHFDVMDDFVQVSDAESFKACRLMALKDGLLVGPSCGSNLAAAITYSKKLSGQKNIVVMLPDSGRSYLSKAFNETWLRNNGLVDSVLLSTKVAVLAEQIGAKATTLTVQAQETVKTVVATLKEKGLTYVPVMSKNKVLGVADVSDILFALAEGRVSPQEPILHVAKTSMPEVSVDETLDQLRNKLDLNSFIRIRETGHLVTKIDLAKFLGEA